MMSKHKKNEGGFTLIELIMVIVILGIISAVAIPKFLSLGDSAKLSAARAVGSAMTGSIQVAHADYLINGTPYTINSVLTGTSFSGGIASTTSTTINGGEIGANAAGEIEFNYKTAVFQWDWNIQVGDDAAYIGEKAGNFPQ